MLSKQTPVAIISEKVMAKSRFIRHLYMKFFLIMCLGIPLSTQAAPALPIATAAHDKEIVVLIHGLMRSSLSMSPLKNYLQHLGYKVYTYDYPSARYSIQQHGGYLNEYIDFIAAENPGVTIHFITHSLGGIITREALARRHGGELKNIGYLIMMAPPNQGSVLAKISSKMFPLIAASIKPLAELSSDQSSYVHKIPLPHIKMGIIAGRWDAKVPPSSAYLQGGTNLVVVNSNHTFIISNTDTKKFITHFLEKGTFTD